MGDERKVSIDFDKLSPLVDAELERVDRLRKMGIDTPDDRRLEQFVLGVLAACDSGGLWGKWCAQATTRAKKAEDALQRCRDLADLWDREVAAFQENGRSDYAEDLRKALTGDGE